MIKQKSLLVILVISIFTFTFISCKKAPLNVSTFRVINVNPDIAEINVKMNKKSLNSWPINQYEKSDIYIVKPCKQNISIENADNSKEIVGLNTSFEPNINHVMFIFKNEGKLAFNLLKNVQINDQNRNPQYALLNIAHLAENASNMEIILKNGSTRINLQASLNDLSIHNIDPAIYDIDIVDKSSNTILYTMNHINMEKGHQYILYTKGKNGANGTEALSADMIENIE